MSQASNARARVIKELRALPAPERNGSFNALPGKLTHFPNSVHYADLHWGFTDGSVLHIYPTYRTIRHTDLPEIHWDARAFTNR